MDTTTYSTSFVNVCSLEQSHIVHGRISWCCSPHKPSYALHLKRHNTVYRCCDRMNTRHQGFNAYCCIAPLSCSQSHWQVFRIEYLSTRTRGCFAALSCAVQLFPVFVIYPPACVDLKPLPWMRNRKLTCYDIPL